MRIICSTPLLKGLLLSSGLLLCAPTAFAQSTQSVPAAAQAATQPGDDAVPPPTPAEEQPEVMTRGPVHEAYATPVDLEPEAKSMAATKAPPAALKETPPAERPDGNQYVWVPGYWAWDDDRQDFIWVSGVWRAVPAGYTWVLVVTSLSAREKCLEAGASDYLAKPVNTEQLLSALRMWLHR